MLSVLLEAHRARTGIQIGGSAIELYSSSQGSRTGVALFLFFTKSQTKAWLGKVAEPAASQEPTAPKSQAHPYAMLATGNMQSLSPNALLWERQGEAALPTQRPEP